MRVRILRPAIEDLAAGRRFYGRQGEQVGASFLKSMFVEIDSLAHLAGVHRAVVFPVLDLRRDPNAVRTDLKGAE